MKKSLCYCCFGLVVGFMVAQAVVLKGAPATQKKCDYTFIQDSGEPNIGKYGEIKYDENWTKVVEAGWTLKGIAGGGTQTVYLFELCR